MNNTISLLDGAFSFVKSFFHSYLELQDFPSTISMLNKDISWFSLGGHTACNNYKETVSHIDARIKSYNGKINISDEHLFSSRIDDTFSLVYGFFTVVHTSSLGEMTSIIIRFSIICRFLGDTFSLYHVNFAVGNFDCTSNYSQKSFELEMLTNNIQAAAIRCSLDSTLTVHFAGDGLFPMIGYTREEFLSECGNSLGAIIHPDSGKTLSHEFDSSLKSGFPLPPLVCNIIKRDGQSAWFAFKGSVANHESPTEFCGVLTDIAELHEQKEAINLSNKRYEVAMEASNTTMFEYDIVTKDLILFEKDANMYGITSIIPDGVNTFIERGIIEPNSAAAYREMYDSIIQGAPFAKCFVNTKDASGTVHDFELILTTVFDTNNKPVRAIGVRKNVTQMLALQKEKDFGDTMVSNKNFICEADITNDTIIQVNLDWFKTFPLPENASYSKLVELTCENLVIPEHRTLVAERISPAYITAAYDRGNKLYSFSYRRKSDAGSLGWYEATVNIIKDSLTGVISIRYYLVDVSELKKKEQKALEEQRLYETMISKAVLAYEVNVTQNLALSGNEHWESQFGVRQGVNYEQQIEAFANKAIYPPDSPAFYQLFRRESVFAAYRSGLRELSCQYRRPNASGELGWVCCTLHIYDDPVSSDIMGYAYVEDIDKQKKAELALQYSAEHDSLTSFFNKATTERLITDFLNTNLIKGGLHALLMIDLDYFKAINDTFGHVFGDAVLSQTSMKIAAQFGDTDIVGRVGGDEFTVFMKNISSVNVALSKAKDVCTAVLETYYHGDNALQLSVSIGISLCSEHGLTYKELYEKADSALYASKKNGRNQFSLYHSGMQTPLLQPAEVDVNNVLEAKVFDENISEYIFRIMYESSDKKASINALLRLIGRHLDISRVYVFENSADNLYTSNTYEWCADNIVPQKSELQNVPYSQLDNYEQNFDEIGIYQIVDINTATESVKRILEPQGIKSMLQFSIKRNGEFLGFIGFDQCDHNWVVTKRELSTCYNVAQILGTFIADMHIDKQNERMEAVALSIVNGLDSFAYVCDPDTHVVIFINDKTYEIAPFARIGQKCYAAFWNLEAPCESCPMHDLKTTGQKKCSMELYNPNLKIWVKATASNISWRGENQACLVDSIDITKYVNKT